MKTINVKLEINGKQVKIGHQFLEDIIREIPEVPQNKSIFEILANSDNDEVREYIAKNEHLNQDTINLLLEDNSQEVVDNLLYNSNATDKLNHSQVMKIIKKNHTKHLCTIAGFLDDYPMINSCKIAKILSNHNNPQVRYNLVRRNNNIVPIKILKKLSKDKDVNVSYEAKKRLEKRLA